MHNPKLTSLFNPSQSLEGFRCPPWPVPDEAWTNAYALIDMQVNEYDEDLRKELSGLHLEPCLPMGAGPGLKTPTLLDLRHCNEEQIALLYQQHYWGDDLENRVTPSIMAARIESAYPIKEVADHIACALILKIGKQRMMWRLNDPGIFAHLGWILRPEQLAALLGEVIERWQINWLGLYYSLNAADLREHYQPTLPPDAHQMALLGYATQINRRMADMLVPHESHDPERFESGHAPSNSLRYAYPYRFLFSRLAGQAMVHAQHTLHLINDDIGLYADYVLRYGREFTHHKSLLAHQQALSTRQMTLTQYMGKLTEQDRQMLDAKPPFYLELDTQNFTTGIF